MDIFEYFSARVPFYTAMLSDPRYYHDVKLSAKLMAHKNYYGNLIQAYIFKNWQQINSSEVIDRSKGLAYIALEADSFLVWIERFTLFCLSNDYFYEIFNSFQEEINYFKFSAFKITRWLEDVEEQRSRIHYLKNIELISLALIITFREALPEDFDDHLICLKLKSHIFMVSKKQSLCTRKEYRIISLLMNEACDLGLLKKTIPYQENSMHQFKKFLCGATNKSLLTPSNTPASLQIYNWFLKCLIFLNTDEISEN